MIHSQMGFRPLSGNKGNQPKMIDFDGIQTEKFPSPLGE